MVKFQSESLSSLGRLVQDRLEEPRASEGLFWNLTGEIYPFLVEALNEAALITGEPQVQQYTAPFTIPGNSTIIYLPVNVVAVLRLQVAGAGIIKKTSLWDLDRLFPGWQNQSPQAAPDYFFPYGMQKIGVYPQLSSDTQAILTFVQLPVPTPRPYTGIEPIDFQLEFRDAFVDYAAHVSQLKEGTKEFQDSVALYNRFIEKMVELSKFSIRKGSLRFSVSTGQAQPVTPVERR